MTIHSLLEAAGTAWPWWSGTMTKIALCLTGALLAERCVRRQSSGVRHWILTLAICAIPLIGLLNLSPVPEIHGWQAANADLPVRITAHPGPSPATIRELLSAPSEDLREISPAPPFPWRGLIVSSWAAGVIILTLRLFLTYHHSRSLRMHVSLPIPDRIRQSLLTGCRHAGIRQAPSLSLSSRTVMTTGMVRPIVFLPADAVHWPTAKRDAVLRHELAHIRRHDLAWTFLTTLLLFLIWPNPLAWIARRRLALLREMACDDAVLRSGVGPIDYADWLFSLLPVAEAPAVGGALHAIRGRQWPARFRHLLHESASRQPLTRRKSLLLALIVASTCSALTLFIGCAGTPAPSSPPERFPGKNPFPVPELPRGTQHVRILLQFFELSLPRDQARNFPAFARATAKPATVLSPEDGWQLFHASRKGVDSFSLPEIRARIGQRVTVDQTKRLTIPSEWERDSLSGKFTPVTFDHKPVGTTAGIAVRPAGDPRHILVDLETRIVAEAGMIHDPTGIDYPYFSDRAVHCTGEFENGSYVIIGLTEDSDDKDLSVSGLSRIPLAGRLFTGHRQQTVSRLAAVRIQVSPE